MIKLALMSLLYFLALPYDLLQHSVRRDVMTSDSLIYELKQMDSKTYFMAKGDLVSFSPEKYRPYRFDSAVLTVEVDAKIFYIDNRIEMSYSIDDTLYHDSGTSYIDLPYGQLYINKGAYCDKSISCNVIINGQQNKNEHNLTKKDWEIADKRKKENINELQIVDSNDQTQFVSARRVSASNQILYEVRFNKCPQKSRMLFKTSLFMILWIYHNNVTKK